MGNRYSRFIQIYKTTELIITWYTCVLSGLHISSLDEFPSFCKLSYNIFKQKFLKTHIGMFQLEPKQKTRTQTQKPGFENTFLPPSPRKWLSSLINALCLITQVTMKTKWCSHWRKKMPIKSYCFKLSTKYYGLNTKHGKKLRLKQQGRLENSKILKRTIPLQSCKELTTQSV